MDPLSLRYAREQATAIADLRQELQQMQANARATEERLAALERAMHECVAGTERSKLHGAATATTASVAMAERAPAPGADASTPAIFDRCGRPDRVWAPSASDKYQLSIAVAQRINAVLPQLTQFANMKTIMEEAQACVPQHVAPGQRSALIIDKMISMHVGVAQLRHSLTAAGLDLYTTYVN